MRIETTRFGTIDVEPDKIITFPQGILGFPESKRFILFPHGSESLFWWLQSLDDGDLAFVTISPSAVCVEDYSFKISDDVQEMLKIEGPEQVEVLLLVTISGKPQQSVTVNLLGPIVINVETRLGAQLILDPVKYPVKYPITSAKNAPLKEAV